MTTFETFKSLHQQSRLFVLANAWNVESARIIEGCGYKATATSSAAVANSLGYKDGENIPFDEYLLVIKRIVSSVKIPVSVDIETGFGETTERIADNIKVLYDLGVAGINIEDSVIQNSQRTLVDAGQFAEKLEKIRAILDSHGVKLFFNVRSDAFLLDVPGKLEESVKRAELYEQAGADGFFLPCITNPDDIAIITAHTNLPLNVLSVDGLPDFETLERLRVKRVSLGDFLFQKVYKQITSILDVIEEEKQCGILFDGRP
jgi:2-methylisocitrate lyase-like PEP mutase family enzyme